MALLADRGASVTVMTATDGEATRGSRVTPEETARRRRAEAVRAAVAELEPDAVFAPWLLDGTPDHRAVAKAVGGALADGGADAQPEVWGYEVWTPLVPNRIVEITSVIGRKREAIAAHRTASLALDLSAGEGLGRWRTLQTLRGRGWAEAFLGTSADQYRALVAELHDGS
jgi:LmbE family N-acetylglucosaminyl deacetylase